MPASSPRDEEKWQKAKSIAKEKGQGENYALIMGIYKKMAPDYFKSAATRVAGRWLIARGGDADYDQWYQDAYDGGKKMVNNTTDTRDQYDKIQADQLKKRSAPFRKLLRGQFARWKRDKEKAGPQGELVESVDQLEKGQTLSWMSRKDKMRGTVDKVKGNRAIIKLDDGRTIHMRPWDVEQLQPRVVG